MHHSLGALQAKHKHTGSIFLFWKFFEHLSPSPIKQLDGSLISFQRWRLLRSVGRKERVFHFMHVSGYAADIFQAKNTLIVFGSIDSSQTTYWMLHRFCFMKLSIHFVSLSLYHRNYTTYCVSSIQIYTTLCLSGWFRKIIPYFEKIPTFLWNPFVKAMTLRL